MKLDDKFAGFAWALPKAFVSLAAGQKLWASRFGQVTSIRIPTRAGVTAVALATRLRGRIDPAELGFAFRAVKRESLAAAEGTTSFSGLFLGFSFFIIAAALMLLGGCYYSDYAFNYGIVDVHHSNYGHQPAHYGYRSYPGSHHGGHDRHQPSHSGRGGHGGSGGHGGGHSSPHH